MHTASYNYKRLIGFDGYKYIISIGDIYIMHGSVVNYIIISVV